MIKRNPLKEPAPGAHILLTLHGDTADLLRRAPDHDKTIVYPLSRRASIKDILEGLGVPHTEMGRIVLTIGLKKNKGVLKIYLQIV